MPHSSAPRIDGRTRRSRSGPRTGAGRALQRAGEAPSYGPGSVVAGRYELVSLLGEGGMGTVWLGRNVTLQIDVAIKLIRRDLSSPEAARRLLLEARAAARLGHPSIVRVLEFGETDRGDPFLVMELLKGELLADLFARKVTLTGTAAVRLLLPIASALVAAHKEGIVHRDLKPENILLAQDGAGGVVPKVLDFGIARLARDEGLQRITSTRAVLGTPEYMSVEQARGLADVDERTDVWALSVILYEAVSGRLPFEGANYNALIVAILGDAPRPIVALGEGEEGLWAIIERGLAKSREERWPTMRHMGRALATWAHAQGVQSDAAGTSLSAHWLAGFEKDDLTWGPDESPSSGVVSEASLGETLAAAESVAGPSNRGLLWAAIGVAVIYAAAAMYLMRAAPEPGLALPVETRALAEAAAPIDPAVTAGEPVQSHEMAPLLCSIEAPPDPLASGLAAAPGPEKAPRAASVAEKTAPRDKAVVPRSPKRPAPAVGAPQPAPRPAATPGPDRRTGTDRMPPRTPNF